MPPLTKFSLPPLGLDPMPWRMATKPLETPRRDRCPPEQGRKTPEATPPSTLFSSWLSPKQMPEHDIPIAIGSPRKDHHRGDALAAQGLLVNVQKVFRGEDGSGKHPKIDQKSIKPTSSIFSLWPTTTGTPPETDAHRPPNPASLQLALMPRLRSIFYTFYRCCTGTDHSVQLLERKIGAYRAKPALPPSLPTTGRSKALRSQAGSTPHATL